MDKIKNILTTVLIALVVSFGTVVVASAPEEAPEDTLGAVSSPDVPSPYLSWGGVRQHAENKGLTTATTTVCAIKSPAATSSLSFAGLELVTSSTTASTITFAKDSDGNGSSTPLQSYSVSAGAQAALTLPATTTTAGIANLVFAPSTFFTVTMAGSAGTFSPTGSCIANFVEL
jgi:hypothetical protein